MCSGHTQPSQSHERPVAPRVVTTGVTSKGHQLQILCPHPLPSLAPVIVHLVQSPHTPWASEGAADNLEHIRHHLPPEASQDPKDKTQISDRDARHLGCYSLALTSSPPQGSLPDTSVPTSEPLCLLVLLPGALFSRTSQGPGLPA